MIDPSSVASVLGIATQYKDMRGATVLFLPQRIAVFAQGSSGVSYSLTKWVATSAAAAGMRYGFGSPIHLIVLQLLPPNGDGVGTIPVTIYPLADAVSSTAAQGDITPSGTMTAAAAYRVRVSGIQSAEFAIPKGVISVNDTLRAMGTAMAAELSMPVTASYTYGAVTASALVGTGNGTITALSVPGGANPKPGAYTLKVNTVVANGGVWTLTDPDGTVVSTTVTMTPGVGGATVITVGGLQFTLTDGTTDFGLGATFTITVPATKLNAKANWKGLTGNDLLIEIIGDTSLGATFAITQPTGGLINPTVDSALTQVGNVWETMVLNQMGFDDTTTLDTFQTFGEGRWGQLVHAPLMVFTGNTKKVVSDAYAVSSARRTDRVNAYLTAPGSVNLPCVVAARQLARIAVIANENPAIDYVTEEATGLLPGTDGDQWDYTARDQAVKAGCSTSGARDGVVRVGDVVTFYHPQGEEPPAYRNVVTIVKLQNAIFNIRLKFATKEWAQAALIPDDQATVNPKARKPRSAVTAAYAVLDGLGLQAIISDPKTAKKKTTATIDSGNANRLNMTIPVQVSGNTKQKSIDLLFGFFFGTQQAAA